MDPDYIKTYFKDLRAVLDRDCIPNPYIYNMDEKGFALGRSAGRTVLAGTHEVTPFEKEPGQREWVSIIECIGARGSVLSQYVIFKGKRSI